MQGDHDDHPNNIVVGYDDGVTPRFVFLDYALALGHVWASGNSGLHALGWRRWDTEKGAQAAVAGTAPPLMWRYASRDELEASVRKIERFPEGTIRDVVGRIPSPYMDRAERDIVAAGLIARRGIVRQVLDRTLNGTQ